MKTNMLSTKIIYFALLAIAIAAGIYVGNVTLYQYELLVNGTLSFTTLYYIYRQYISVDEVSRKLPTGIYIELPKDLKVIFFSFFMTVIVFWASKQIVDIVLFLMKTLISG